MTSLTRLGVKIRRKLSMFATPPLPRRVKRLIFISSILGLINGANDPDKFLVEKLNKLLLVGYDKAWTLPMHAKSLIWTSLGLGVITLENSEITIGELKNRSLSNGDFNIISGWFIDRTPEWLLYGSRQLMEHDITTMIRQIRELETA